jgi:hypothetical protein
MGEICANVYSAELQRQILKNQNQNQHVVVHKSW